MSTLNSFKSLPILVSALLLSFQAFAAEFYSCYNYSLDNGNELISIRILEHYIYSSSEDNPDNYVYLGTLDVDSLNEPDFSIQDNLELSLDWRFRILDETLILTKDSQTLTCYPQRSSTSHSCPYPGCKEAISSQNKFESHLRAHTNKKTYECQECGKVLSRGDSLKAHMRTHSGEKPFKCGKCPQTFRNSSNLLIHERIHTGEKPFKCTFQNCNKAFNQASALSNHLSSHSKERPYKCPMCDKTYKTPGDLSKHVHKHSGKKFICNECGDSFLSSGNLSQHKRIHSTEMPYKCTFENCTRGFKQTGNLKTHLLTHTGEKPFKCKLCEYASITSTNLKKHENKYHKSTQTEQPNTLSGTQ